MITFEITIIINFSLELKTKEKGKNNKKEIKSTSDNINKKGKNAKNVGKKVQKEAPIKPKHLFEAEKLFGVVHIEYVLIPNQQKYEIDVKCWGKVAQIFTNDGQLNIKTIVRDNIAWIPICIRHNVPSMNLEQIQNFHNYIIKFDFSNDISKLGKWANKDNCKNFYSFADEVDLDRVIQVYDYDPNLEENHSVQYNETKQSVKNASSKTDFVSRLYYSENFDNVYEIINKHCAGAEIEYKDFALPCSLQKPPKKVTMDTKEKKDKPTKDKKKKKDKKGQNIQLNTTMQVPAEVFFTDPNSAVYKGQCENGVMKNIYLLVSVDQLLSRAQKLKLDPLVVKIKKLSNVPVDAIEQMGITSLYTSYHIPAMTTCVSVEKPVTETVRFNDAHIFFNNDVPKLKLIEFIQTRTLYVEIYGVKTKWAPEPKTVLFGNEANDKTISTISKFNVAPETESKGDPSILLAVCTYDISSIVQNIWDFKEKGQCHAPGLTLYQECPGSYDVIDANSRNVNVVNLRVPTAQTKHISESVFLELGTTLKVEVYLMAPQTVSLILLQIPNTFKRFLFILQSWDMTRNMLTSVLKHNDRVRWGKPTVEELEFADVVTGFIIDNGYSRAIFLEGLSAGGIVNIENLTMTNYETEKGKIFFNSDTVFEKRLYGNFLKEGLCVVTLRIPLDNILKKQRIYTDENVPYRCWEALKKLHLLFHSSTSKSILQFNLLPKPEELLSLSIEWGVPLMTKKDEGFLKKYSIY